MKAWEANSVLFFLPTIWWLGALKRREEIIRESTFEQKKKKPRLKFNPGLELIGLRTTGPRAFVPISWNRLKNEVKKHIFYQCFQLILIVIAYILYKFTANFSEAEQITQCGLSLVLTIIIWLS